MVSSSTMGLSYQSLESVNSQRPPPVVHATLQSISGPFSDSDREQKSEGVAPPPIFELVWILVSVFNFCWLWSLDITLGFLFFAYRNQNRHFVFFACITITCRVVFTFCTINKFVVKLRRKKSCETVIRFCFAIAQLEPLHNDVLCLYFGAQSWWENKRKNPNLDLIKANNEWMGKRRKSSARRSIFLEYLDSSPKIILLVGLVNNKDEDYAKDSLLLAIIWIRIIWGLMVLPTYTIEYNRSARRNGRNYVSEISLLQSLTHYFGLLLTIGARIVSLACTMSTQTIVTIIFLIGRFAYPFLTLIKKVELPLGCCSEHIWNRSEQIWLRFGIAWVNCFTYFNNKKEPEYIEELTFHRSMFIATCARLVYCYFGRINPLEIPIDLILMRLGIICAILLPYGLGIHLISTYSVVLNREKATRESGNGMRLSVVSVV